MNSFNSKHLKNKGASAPPTIVSVISQGALVVVSFIWILAVIKVFLLEGNRSITRKTFDLQRSDSAKPVLFARSQSETNPAIFTYSDSGVRTFISLYDEKKRKLTDKAAKIVVPTASEWAFIRASPDYRIAGDREPVVVDVAEAKAKISHGHKVGGDKKDAISEDLDPVAAKMKKAFEARVAADLLEAKLNAANGVSSKLTKQSDLIWPPVQQDGTILASDGVDIMPVIGLKVPRFYMPATEAELNKVGSKVNGQETIFLMIASYRDFQCRETITSAYMRSDHPERLFVGAVDQTVAGDIGCLDIDIPCTVDNTQPICKYRDQISVFNMDAMYATGPVTARHVGDRMYRGETYVMQMDAHCQFVNHWDTLLIKQWSQTQNEMAVLSSYLTDVQESISPAGDSLRNSRPIMCNSDFEGEMPARYLRHGSQPEMQATIRDMPQLQPYWAAGFSFSRGHFKLRVPYDAYQPMVFQGEEINVGIRGFTHGYDFYAPRDSVVFHEYAEKSSRRKKIHMFWENSQAHKGEAKKSISRATALIGMAPDLDPSTYDHSETERYGIGKVRPLDLFYKIFLVDPLKRKAVPLCPFVTTGIMHKEFQKYLRPDHLGIDYSFLHDFDTKAELLRKSRIY